MRTYMVIVAAWVRDKPYQKHLVVQVKSKSKNAATATAIRRVRKQFQGLKVDTDWCGVCDYYLPENRKDLD